ncbi:EAL domain-containing protein [Ruminococcus sp.]|uniref:EAL domain-containing protein n=1 Tax=Ruminococcus sp. TaxID=41978 RepID=UPI0025DEF6A6|nr:EAL domain-containing protein [Ruminococcus sp.]MBQ8967664.1 EAL domain-containing protein [Ruminococcus sp.]
MTTNEKSTVGGMRAVELYYRAIRNISEGSTAFYQSQTRLNTPGLGVLMPENFRDVSEITQQCISLFELEVIQALEAVNTFNQRELLFNWLSVYMPSKYLRDIGAENRLMDITEKLNVRTSQVCFTLSEKLFEETETVVAENIKKLRNRGFHFMLTDFGGISSPIMKLSEYEVDYVMLSPEITQYLGRDERSDSAVKSLIDFVSGLGAEPIADGISNVHQAETLYSFECMYCAGSLAGKYMAERYVRRKNAED